MPRRQHNSSENEMLNKTRSAAILGISVKFLDKLINGKEIPAYKYGDSQQSVIRIKKTDIKKYMEECKI